MLLDFDINKAIAATGFLLEREGGSDDMFPLLKKLYYADRLALIEWGQPITGDKLASLAKGPIVSGIYDLLKGKGSEEDLIKWNNFIHRRQPYTIELRKAPNQGILSKREKRVLEESRTIIDAIRGSIPAWFHEHCPEWTDPGRSSSPIDPSTILRLAKKSEEEIQRLEEANQEIRFLKYLMASH
ncbi:MAG: Panacea domain-containing protein [Terracidiphilus sp.]